MSLNKCSLRAMLASLMGLALMLCAPVCSFGQESDAAGSAALVQGVKRAFDAGDHSSISSLFGTTVELQLPNVSGIFSRKQSEMIVGQFLSAHTGLAYELDHKEGTAEATMTIGRATRQGEAFRVCILSQQSGNSLQIIQFRIETLK